MRVRLPLALLVVAAAAAPIGAQEPYRRPPQAIVEMLDAPALPVAVVSPDRTWMLLPEQPSMPTIAEVSAPMLRLAGYRLNPRTNGPTLPGRITGILLKRIADGAERRITVPA